MSEPAIRVAGEAVCKVCGGPVIISPGDGSPARSVAAVNDRWRRTFGNVDTAIFRTRRASERAQARPGGKDTQEREDGCQGAPAPRQPPPITSPQFKATTCFPLFFPWPDTCGMVRGCASEVRAQDRKKEAAAVKGRQTPPPPSSAEREQHRAEEHGTARPPAGNATRRLKAGRASHHALPATG